MTKPPKPKLILFDELPEWYQDNPHIHHGYRPVSGSTRASIASWRHVHNETINIHTHLVPCAAFLLGEWYVLQHLHARYAAVALADKLVFAAFLLAAAVCLGLSAAYHTLINHSQAMERMWLRLDLVGIVLLTVGDLVSGVYMVFWCEPLQRWIYWAMILSLGSLTVLVVVHPRFQGPRWRGFRIACFVGTGMSGLAPLAHGLYLFGLPTMMRQSGMPYYLAEGGLLCLGVSVYATRFPESVWPGKFDIYGSSHQIFHLLVVLATVTQLVGLLAAFDYNYQNRACLPIRVN
ncbi:hypothetical protein J7T55_010257 [Diaporthe amygdali]|uniref:uncharacterized protein n=1 Tax=Phomopsis amygdali TaxID=1214568 RepID=UPI0022FE755D|nr:uncharacterized protein J7T55_010257 [Diaporthe amygdali]KAJ0107652.1 hypothetical protein J7T55_010257 [Diaporthe amygdali]